MIACCARLKREGGLQLDLAGGVQTAAWADGLGDGLAKNRRRNDADWGPDVHIVEDVSRVHCKRKAVTLARAFAAAKTWPAAAIAASAAWTAGPAAKRATLRTASRRVGLAFLAAETEGFAQT